MRKRQEAADEARRKMDEERSKQMEFLKAASSRGGRLSSSVIHPCKGGFGIKFVCVYICVYIYIYIYIYI